MANMTFAEEIVEELDTQKTVYKLLIVDDEESIHEISNLAIKAMYFPDFKVEVLSAYSAKEAKEVLQNNDNIAIALIDVVMETPEAGLELVDYIRKDLKNEMIRLVIRTGQANEFPQMEVIQRYDINDFKEKTELTLEKLYTTIRTSVKQYEHLIALQKRYEDTYYQMTINQLTKLPNRNKLHEDCNNSKNKTLILIDIVNFSHINETNGYEIGDFVLCKLGGFLQNMYKDQFNVYHLESDLFALVHIGDGVEDIISVVEIIKDDISKLNIVTDNFNKTIDITIGVSCEHNENMMRRAELALKEARNRGINQIKFYSEDLKIIKQLKITNKWSPIIKEALKKGNMLAYYQPIFNLKTNEIDKHELLVRLNHDGVLYQPVDFLDAAEYSGQLYDIFKFMFETACKKTKENGKKYSVNIGTSEFEHEDLVTFIEDILKKYNIETGLISIELLEYTAINQDVKDALVKIHNLGVEIIIDDFGVQCSNFGQIKDLPIDILKIDGSFIENLPSSKNNQIIIRAIKTFADEKNIKLVAEFVCDEDVYKMVKSLGINYGQGYYLGKPEKEPII